MHQVDSFAKEINSRLDSVEGYAREIALFAENVNTRLNSIDEYKKSINLRIADLESQNRLLRIIQKVVRKLRRMIRRGNK